MKKDKFYEQLKDLVITISEGGKREIENISFDIDDIIECKITDKRTIEGIFDRLLSIEFVAEEDMKPVYFRLLKYYRKIDKRATDAYKQFFIEKFSEDDEFY